MEFWKGRQKENPKRKQNRKKRRISKTGLLGTQKRKRTLKLQEIAFWFFSKQKHKDKKQNHHTTKNKQKTPFCMLANTPLFLVMFFSSYTLYFRKAVLRWKHYKNSAFSRTQLLGITDSKAPFEAPSQNGTFATKSAILGFPLCLLKPLFCSVWWLWMGTKKDHFPKTDSCNENALFFTFWTQIVSAYFSKNAISAKNIFFVHNHLKTHFCFFLTFSFPCFWYFL